MSSTSGRRITYPEFVAQEIRAMLTLDGHAYCSVEVDGLHRVVVTIPDSMHEKMVAVF